MALRRFWVEAFLGAELVIDGDLFHHIRGVCRFGVGDRFEVLPGDGGAHLVEIEEMAKHSLRAKVLSKREIEPLPRPWIHLALSIPKFNKVDWIVEKSAELGVKTLSLFSSDHSFVRKPLEVTEPKMERWRKINVAAAQQSGRGTLMELRPPKFLSDLLVEFRETKSPGIFPYEGDATLSFKDAVQTAGSGDPPEVWVFVGSEGGFSLKEVEMFRAFGLRPMTMGSQILRVETACVALVSVLKYQFGV